MSIVNRRLVIVIIAIIIVLLLLFIAFRARLRYQGSTTQSLGGSYLSCVACLVAVLPARRESRTPMATAAVCAVHSARSGCLLCMLVGIE